MGPVMRDGPMGLTAHAANAYKRAQDGLKSPLPRQPSTVMAKARKCCCTPEPYKHLLYLALYFERVS